MTRDRLTGTSAAAGEPASSVVAGLTNNGALLEIARAAVVEAERRGARVRFVQVLPPGASPDERADADLLTFRAALQALHGRSRVAFTFETVDGDPAEVLVGRSSDAVSLVIGEDAPDDGHAVARYCREHAACEVITVPGSVGAPA